MSSEFIYFGHKDGPTLHFALRGQLIFTMISSWTVVSGKSAILPFRAISALVFLPDLRWCWNIRNGNAVFHRHATTSAYGSPVLFLRILVMGGIIVSVSSEIGGGSQRLKAAKSPVENHLSTLVA